MASLDAADPQAAIPDRPDATAHASAHDVWALLGNRVGDNRMIETVAAATGAPWRGISLRFNPLGALPNVLAGGSLHTLAPGMRPRLAPPWPRVVITSGKRAVPVALWVRAASGGATRLVHLGRPQAPLGWFDLVITSPQYGLPARPNVVTYRFPPTAPVTPRALAPDLAALPRPRLAVVVGGATEPLALDRGVGRAVAAAAEAEARRSGGSILAVTSPRTGTAAARGLEEGLDASGVPFRLCLYGRGENRYRDFLAAADAVLVTDDTASMAIEVAMTGAPVALYRLPVRPKLHYRARAGLQALMRRSPAGAQVLDGLVGLGAVRSNRDLAGFMRGLESGGFLSGGDRARAQAEAELRDVADRVRALLALDP